jgi:CheY-like chemotaxis protein
MAHSLSNALSGVVLYTEIGLRSTPLSDSLRECLNNIRKSAADATHMLMRARDFYSGRTPGGSQSVVDLKQILQDVILFTRFKWKDEPEARGIAIELRTSLADVPCIAANASELREAFTNLVVNAVDAMPDGGTLTLTTWAEDDSVLASVRDTGRGMSDTTLSRVFQPFFTTKGPQGTGLGLSLCAEIMQRHGGVWEVSSRLGEGSAFTVKFAAVADARPAVKPLGVPASPLRILCVDDQLNVRRGLETLLRQQGHSVVSAGSGQEALALVEHLAFDVLLTDLGMGGMTGLELAQAVKVRLPHVAVVLLTGWSDVTPDAVAALKVDFVLRKPPTPEGLEAALAAVASGPRG